MGKSTEMQQLGEAMQYFKSALKSYYAENELNSIVSRVFMHVLGLSRIDLHVQKERRITEGEHVIIMDFIRELKQHKPLQYIIGEAEFYNLHFEVNKNVLIPRPETEELVHWIINEESSNWQGLTILDIGTGSGCIAVSLAKFLKNSVIYANDSSEKALALAQKNAVKNAVEIQFSKVDILQMKDTKLPYRLDIIVSNPPYISQSEKAYLLPNVFDHEPHEALFVPAHDALIFYRAIRDFASLNLCKGGRIYLEINEKYGEQCSELLGRNGFGKTRLRKDINGKHRMLKAIKLK